MARLPIGHIASIVREQGFTKRLQLPTNKRNARFAGFVTSASARVGNQPQIVSEIEITRAFAKSEKGLTNEQDN